MVKKPTRTKNRTKDTVKNRTHKEAEMKRPKRKEQFFRKDFDV